jgi:hypothetical protein
MISEQAVTLVTFGLAVVGIAAAGGAIVVGLRILRMAGVQTEEIGRLRQRIDALEAEWEALAIVGDAGGGGGAAAESLVAAKLSESAYPRLVAEAGPPIEMLPALAVMPSPDDAATVSPELDDAALGTDTDADSWPGADALAEPTAAELRTAFATLVRARNHRAALAAGEEIVDLFPNSRMAADFQRLRPYLEARLRRKTARSAEAG